MNAAATNSNIVGREMSDVLHEYYISPKVKALETGFKCSEDLFLDYKDELADALKGKHLR